MSSLLKNFITAAILIGAIYVLNAMMSSTGFFEIGIDDYQARLFAFIGVNIILATSLNLINGCGGMFSLGRLGAETPATGASNHFFRSIGCSPSPRSSYRTACGHRGYATVG